MKKGKYLSQENNYVWVFDDLHDPLCGDKSDIERYLSSPHQYPNLAVKLAPSSIWQQTYKDQFLINYGFNIDGQKLVVVAETGDSELRRRRREFVNMQNSPILVKNWSIERRMAHPYKTVETSIYIQKQTSLFKNVSAALALKHDLAARLSRVV